MAHELQFEGDGKANFFEVGTALTAWHREGHLLPPGTTLQQAIEVANLDYEVRKIAVDMHTPDKGLVQSKSAYVTMREPRTRLGEKQWVELGPVGKGYEVIQNGAAFRVLEPMIDAGVLRLDCGGVLRDGADAWINCAFDVSKFGPVVQEVFAGEVVPYALVRVNHTGRRETEVATVPTRVVCANTLQAAETELDRGAGRAISVRHSKNAEQKLVEAAEALFGAIIERYEVIAAQYRALKALILDRQAFESLVIDTAIPDPRKHSQWSPEARMATAVVERWERRSGEVTRLWTEGKGHVGDHSAWEAYNGLVEAIDHNADLFPVRAGCFRTASLLDGVLGQTKQLALNALTEAAQDAGS